MNLQFTSWQSIQLQTFSSSLNSVAESVAETDNTLTGLSSEYIYFYDGNNTSGYGEWGSYNISVKGRNFLGSSSVVTNVKLSTSESKEKLGLTGKLNSDNTSGVFLVTGGTFSSLTHTDTDGKKDYSIKGSFVYANGSINGGSISSANIDQSSGKLTLTGTLDIDSSEVITGGTITALTYSNADGNSFSISGASIDFNALQSVIDSANGSDDFSILSDYFTSSSMLSGKDTITGDDDANVLDGYAGKDVLVGGKGDDTYVVDLLLSGKTPAKYKVSLEDTVTEKSKAGNDTLQLRGEFEQLVKASTLTLAKEIENLDASNTGSTLLNLTGNKLSNIITGNDANNIIKADAGNDTLIGGLGADTLTGGKGNDTFTFLSASESTSTDTDIITDFKDGDLIDLSAINLEGETLSFGNTTPAAYSVWYAAVGKTTLIYVDTNGDTTEDMQIQLTGNITLAADDFILS